MLPNSHACWSYRPLYRLTNIEALGGNVEAGLGGEAWAFSSVSHCHCPQSQELKPNILIYLSLPFSGRIKTFLLSLLCHGYRTCISSNVSELSHLSTVQPVIRSNESSSSTFASHYFVSFAKWLVIKSFKSWSTSAFAFSFKLFPKETDARIHVNIEALILEAVLRNSTYTHPRISVLPSQE